MTRKEVLGDGTCERRREQAKGEGEAGRAGHEGECDAYDAYEASGEAGEEGDGETGSEERREEEVSAMVRGGAMAKRPKLSADEKKWRAQDDARTLAEAEAIKADEERLKAAQAAAKSMADEAQVKARAMTKIAAGRVRGRAT